MTTGSTTELQIHLVLNLTFIFETGSHLCSSAQLQTCDSPYLSLLSTRMACPAHSFFFLNLNTAFIIVWGFICAGTQHTCGGQRSALRSGFSHIPLYLGPTEQTRVVMETSAYSAEPSHQLSRCFLKQRTSYSPVLLKYTNIKMLASPKKSDRVWESQVSSYFEPMKE